MAGPVEGHVVPEVQEGGMTEPREAIICEECGRALAGIVELVDHYLLRHEHEEAA
jgi:hypothetical protein